MSKKYISKIKHKIWSRIFTPVFALIYVIVWLRDFLFRTEKENLKIRSIAWFGAYGNTNIGDDLIFFSLKQYIPDHITIYLSCRQKEPTTNYGIKTFYRQGFSQYNVIKQSDFVLLGGGGLFEFYRDSFPTTTLLNYMYPLLMAKYYKKRYAIIGMGCNVQPFQNRFLRNSFNFLTNNAELIITRDEKSSQGFINNNYNRNLKNLVSSYDPVFSLSSIIKNKTAKTSNEITIGFLLWPYYLWPAFHSIQNIDDIREQISAEKWNKHMLFCDELNKLFSILEQKDIKMVFPLFHFSDKVLLDHLKCNYENNITFDTYFSQLTSCDIVISMRYHVQITSIANNIPVISIPVQEKMSALVENFGLEDYSIDIDEFSANKCMEIIDNVMKNKEELKSKLANDYNIIYQKVENAYKENFKKIFL